MKKFMLMSVLVSLSPDRKCSQQPEGNDVDMTETMVKCKNKIKNKKWSILDPFFCLFSSFQTNITILTTNTCGKCPSSMQCWDSNSRPLEHESPCITTRPGHPPYLIYFFVTLSLYLSKSSLTLFFARLGVRCVEGR